MQKINTKTNQKLIIISGNIGAGKSTYMHYFVEELKKVSLMPVILVEEGIESDITFQEKLDAFYKDKNKRLDFQKYITEFRHKRLNEYPDNVILVSERGLMDDIVFSNANSLDLENVHGEFVTYYYDLIRRLREDYPKIYANIYLKTDPNQCFYNIFARGRETESNIQKSYINTLHHCHEAFLPVIAQTIQYPLITKDYYNGIDKQLLTKNLFNELKNIIDFK